MVLAILTEVRRSYVAEEHRARQLAEAYQREQWHSQQLQEADQVRVAMLRVLSHELSHPVATIRSYLVALLQHRDRLHDPDLKRMIVAMEGESRDLRDLASRVDAVAHLGRQQFDIEPRPVRAKYVLRSAAMFEASLGDRLAIAPTPSLGEVTIMADLSRIRQVFRNLLSNAAKYGGHGIVRVSAEPQDSEVVFTVADSGPGIASEDRKWVFRQFSRLEHPPRSALGSGLGLYICQRIVEAHGGRIWVEDSETGGAAFSFTVPVANGAHG
jgi:signal transduction histidine kinase